MQVLKKPYNSSLICIGVSSQVRDIIRFALAIALLANGLILQVASVWLKLGLQDQIGS